MIPGTTSRFVRDGALITTMALPAAGATNTSPSLDLGNPPGRIVDNFDVVVEVPATPSLADTKNLTLTLVHSSDNVTFVAIPGLAPIVATGAGGLGAAAVSQRVKLPETTNEYIALQQTVDAAGGNNTAISGSLSLLF